ncbi:hypothetical protein L7F22_063751 [Adiantum nelumboides]|nr:hypothetical protein [Adiantum nelumboides]
MKLRSGCIPNRMLDQEASSRIRPLDTPPKRKNRISKRCVFIDDEAQVDEDSNNIEDDTNFTETNVHVEDLHYNNEYDSDDSGQEEGDGGEKKKHSRHLGKQVSLGLMKDVLSQFYVKKQTLPFPIPLCRLVVHEAVRFARDDNEWLISSFDSSAYLETMGHFLVSVGDSREDVMHVTTTDLENWGPLWRQRNDEFERKLEKEWQELKIKKFLNEFNAFMSKEIAKVDAVGLNDLEKKKRLDKATKVEEERLKDRGYKYLSIANPLNGDEFFKLLFGIKWDDPGFKKESNEYVEGVLEESVPQVSHEGTLVTIESDSQATPLANNALDRGKGPTQPPGTTTVPNASSMIATTPSRAPSTSSLPAASPFTTPSSMAVPTSSLMHTTSFVAESSLGREVWERKHVTRSVGLQYQTVIDVLLVDICQIDKFALASINNFFATQKTNLYSKAGVPCCKVARLIFADFSTSLLVDGLGSTPLEDMSVPKWNTFSRRLVTGCMDLARENLADEGFLVTMCVAKHIGEFIAKASRVGLVLLCTWTLMCSQKAYRHPLAVLDLTISLWYRVGHPVPCYDRDAREMISKRLFPADCSYMWDDSIFPIDIDGIIARGRAERSSSFFRWLLATFTEPYDYVLDVFAGVWWLGSRLYGHNEALYVPRDRRYAL